MELQIRSHVARDLLQSADLFRTDKTVVWEYVSNGIQYVDPGIKPEVHVQIDGKRRRIEVRDNGRGMLWDGLQNFFVMHGENLDRRQGRPGRGNFGTGKSAAFGIAEGLRITTVRSGRRSCVELSRSEIEAMRGEGPIPVMVHEKEVPTDDPNGTLIEISGIHLRSIDQAAIIRFIERHLARWPRDVTVFVNNHQCEFNDPPVERELTFVPDEGAYAELGNVTLTIKVAKAPLDEDRRGISIFSKGVWCETTLAGAEGREMSHYIFGDIDIPSLDEYKGPIRPIDMSRSMKLNPNNPLVQRAYSFIGEKVDIIRRDLVRRDRERRATEELRRLQTEANSIANVINEDFEEFRRKLQRVKAQNTGGRDDSNDRGNVDWTELMKPGGETPGAITTRWPEPPVPQPSEDAERPLDDGSDGDEGTREAGKVLAKSEDGSSSGLPSGTKQGRGRRPIGGFNVRFGNLGTEEHRAKYVRDERTIYINLDHPQVEAAKGLGYQEDIAFRRLTYEVAFAEYAVALASERAGADEYFFVTDPIVEIRDTLNRLATKGARLYAIDSV
jgi:hypothetical protein